MYYFLYLFLASLKPIIYIRAQPFGLLKPRLLKITLIEENVGTFILLDLFFILYSSFPSVLFVLIETYGLSIYLKG